MPAHKFIAFAMTVFEAPWHEGNVESHWQTITHVKDEEHDLSHPVFKTLNGKPFPNDVLIFR